MRHTDNVRVVCCAVLWVAAVVACGLFQRHESVVFVAFAVVVSALTWGVVARARPGISVAETLIISAQYAGNTNDSARCTASEATPRSANPDVQYWACVDCALVVVLTIGQEMFNCPLCDGGSFKRVPQPQPPSPPEAAA